MSYDLLCWASSANMTPDNPAFEAWRDSKYQASDPEPSPALIAFADALLARYPDLDSDEQDTVWAFGPIKSSIAADYMDLHIDSEAPSSAIKFILETARKHGIDCLDPQDAEFYPAAEPSRQIGSDVQE